MFGWATTTSWLKKQYFNGMHLIDIASSNISNKCTHIYIFGIQFDMSKEQQKHQAMALYQSILWFTYRENIVFSELKYGEKIISPINNDIGWGCMLRVGQMMLAQVFRVHAGMNKYSDQEFLRQLLKQFVTSENGQFTIQKICQAGLSRLQKKVGEWYTPADIAFAIQEIMIKPNKIIPQLKVIVSNSEMELDGILLQAKNPATKNIKPFLFIVLIRIGYQKPEEALLRNVTRIITQQPLCIGILGGRPGKAHYLVGTTNDSFLYLDPHCVKNQQNIQSFLPPSLFTLSHDKIDPSMGICFYINNLKNLLNLYSYLSELKDSPIYAYSKASKKIEYLEIQKQQEQISDNEQFQDLVVNDDFREI